MDYLYFETNGVNGPILTPEAISRLKLLRGESILPDSRIPQNGSYGSKIQDGYHSEFPMLRVYHHPDDTQLGRGFHPGMMTGNGFSSPCSAPFGSRKRSLDDEGQDVFKRQRISGEMGMKRRFEAESTREGLDTSECQSMKLTASRQPLQKIKSVQDPIAVPAIAEDSSIVQNTQNTKRDECVENQKCEKSSKDDTLLAMQLYYHIHGEYEQSMQSYNGGHPAPSAAPHHYHMAIAARPEMMYNTSAMEHQTTMAEAKGYEDLYLYDIISQMHGS